MVGLFSLAKVKNKIKIKKRFGGLKKLLYLCQTKNKMVDSSSGPGRLPFPVTNRGSNPLSTTKN